MIKFKLAESRSKLAISCHFLLWAEFEKVKIIIGIKLNAEFCDLNEHMYTPTVITK